MVRTIDFKLFLLTKILLNLSKGLIMSILAIESLDIARLL